MGGIHLVGFAEIGSYLREVRQSLGVDADVAARALNLRPSYLEALEKGDMSVLPGLAYARGYLSTYVDYLQTDKAMVLAAFDEAGRFRDIAPYCPEPTRRGVRPGWGLFIICGLALIAMMITWQQLVSRGSEGLDTGGGEQALLSVAAPAQLVAAGTVVPQARACMNRMTVGTLAEKLPFCYWQPLPDWLGMTPRMRYSTELQFPTYMLFPDVD